MPVSYNKQFPYLHTTICDTALAILHKANPEDHYFYKNPGKYARTWGNDIHDITPVPTGYASVNCINYKLVNWSYSPTHDHFLGRQNGGLELVRLVQQCVSEQRLPKMVEIDKILTRYCSTHYVTKEENLSVVSGVNSGLPWHLEYSNQGIKLIPDTKPLFHPGKRLSMKERERIVDEYKERLCDYC